ncbi:MAG: UDP-3-O-(3-hydroxymyristoyl)glucosamine N-acyltransferase [Kaiparowitsia implicata GSE-PSE-MK54-09C]|nr:UDP-3-O-(3-hydroxymyristoyl)glucosamine N-acyltransferase [Kaiparowitsia implicata GSE-PSE-MK54-09C]
MQFRQVVQALGQVEHSSLAIEANLDPQLLGMAAVNEAQAGQLAYIGGDKHASQITTTQASALILPFDQALQAAATERGIAWVAVPHPRLAFARAIALFYQPFRLAPGIHPTAVIDPSVQLGEGVAIGPHVVIQPGCTIGDHVCIHPNVVIYPKVTVGDRTLLHANCVLHERCQLGADCVIHAGAVIGSEGFGFVPTAEGWLKMEQSGITVLEDGVEVGCNSTIDRPAVGETRIGRQTKLDNLVHIGHGSTIGEACALAAQTGLAGGVRVGNRVMMGGQVGIANQVHVGDRAQVGAQSGLHHDIPAGEVVSGTPAISSRLHFRIATLWKRLPEMHQTLKQLQREKS